MDPITTAQLGMSTTYATRDNEPAPTARPRSAVPIGRPMATIDPKARSRITIATARPRASPTPVGACSNAKYRSPPASMRRSVESRRSSRVALRLSRSAGDSSARSGYWTRIRATRPSGDTRSLVAEHVRERRQGVLDPVQRRPARGGVEKVSAGSRGVRTTSAPRPMSADPARVSSSVARWESSPGASNGSSSSRPNAAAEVTTTMQTAAHVAITTQGRRAASRPSRSSAPDTVGLLGVRPAFGHAASSSTVGERACPAHRRRGRDAACFRPGANQTFGRSWPRRASLGWAGDQPAAVRPGRTARAVATGAGVAGLGAGRRRRRGRRAGGRAARGPAASVAVLAGDGGAGADAAVAAYAPVRGGGGGVRRVRRRGRRPDHRRRAGPRHVHGDLLPGPAVRAVPVGFRA